MKKHITIATLLAVGSLCANANGQGDPITPPSTEDWQQVTFQLAANTTGTVSNNSVTGGRASFSSFTLNGQTLESISADLYSWELSFQVTKGIDQNEKLLFSSGQGSTDASNGNGYCIGTMSNGNGFALKIGEQGFASKTNATGTQAIAGSNTSTVKLIWDASGNKLYFGVVPPSGDEVQSRSTTSTFYSVNSPQKDSLNLIKSTKISTSSPNGSIFWTNGGAQNISNISLKVRAIPEPSMFGLLAGMGALALVSSRRRRRK